MKNQNFPELRITNVSSNVKRSRNLVKKYSIGENKAQNNVLSTKESYQEINSQKNTTESDFQQNFKLELIALKEKCERTPSFGQNQFFFLPSKFDDFGNQFNLDDTLSERRLLQKAKSQKLFNLNKNDFIAEKIQKLNQITSKLSEIKKNLVDSKIKLQEQQKKSLKDSQIAKELRRNQELKINKKIDSLIKQLRNYYVQPLIQGYPKVDSQHMIHTFNNIKKFSAFNQTHKYIQNRSQNTFTLNLNQSKENNKKATLILDLDETLVYCRKYNQASTNPSSNVIQMSDKNGKKVKIQVLIRPYAKKFLSEVSKYYELIVFTASKKMYAQQIISILDPFNKFISHALYRQHCTVYSSTSGLTYVKDLRILNRDLDNMLIVDNELTSYLLQIQNGIPIIPYSGDESDCQLKKLQNYLVLIKSSPTSLKKTNSLVFQSGQHHKFSCYQIKELVQKYKNYKDFKC